jgi:indolepyruvate ferredoxin oxidoreductase, alpha subunit
MLTDNKPGQVALLMGNQAVVRGALEAGIDVAATYPGTPASEIGDTFAKIAKQAGIYFEYATNEKVAFETALSASWSGLRTLVSMKHVGLNVAADALMSITYGGTDGGMVLVMGDDPSCFSSQNEQDSRNYARFAQMPCLEPSNAHETKEMVKYAFELSEKFRLPVMIRETTRIAHGSGNVVFGALPEKSRQGNFKRDKVRKAVLPAHAYQLHPDLLKRIDELALFVEESPWIHMELKGKIGIIANGNSMNYAKEALKYENLSEEVSTLHLGFTYPLPRKQIETFLRHCDVVLIAEELDPITEEYAKTMAYDLGLSCKIHGKDLLPKTYEFDTGILHKAIVKLNGITPKESFDISFQVSQEMLPPRYPVLCPGCPHRATFFAIKKAFPKAVYTSDIGCYTLGIQPPLNAVDTCVCMGASISMGVAFSKFLPDKVVATIGDSTFFHTGIPALANASYNGSKATIVVVDNSITAMTGQQPCPSCGISSLGDPCTAILPEKIAEALNIPFVRVVDPLDLTATIKIMKEANQLDDTSVIIARSICCMIDKVKRPLVEVVEDTCIGCQICTKTFGCPALIWNAEKKKVHVDHTLCNGCAVCIQVCPSKAIKGKES